ncbi:Uncharacterised protein [Burkholderia pseudomallei]|nr:Uncharacterised protein [Burkholderia pseudomallei]
MFRRAIAHLRCRISRKHDHLAHPRHLRQLRLDLSQLDPETAYLHLEVVSTQIFQPPVRAPTRQISRPIQPPARHERIVDEPLPRQLRPVQVPACDTRPAHIQLSRHAHRHRLATIIQHVQLQIRNPHADRTRTQTHGVFRSQRTIRHVHRRLGDSIHVHQLRTLAVTGIPRRERPRLQRLSTEDDIAQPVGDYVCALDIPGRLLPLLLRRHQRLKRARRLIQHRHAFRAQQRKERRRRARYLRRHDHQPTTVQQRAPHLPYREVEAVRMEQRPHVPLVEAKPCLRRAEQAHNLRVLDHHPLRPTRRARRVDHIGKVVHMLRCHLRIGRRHLTPAQRIRFRIDHRQRTIQLAQRRAPHRVRQHQGRLAVLHDPAQAIRRICRIQRHIRTARLQDRQQPHHHLDSAFRAKRNQSVRAHAAPLQIVRKPVRSGVEFRVAQSLSLERQRNRLRLPIHLRFEQLMNALLDRIVTLRCVPLVHHLLAFGFVEQRQAHDRLVRGARCHAFQQTAPIGHVTPHRRFVEQRARVIQVTDDVVARLLQRQRQFELRRLQRRLHGADRQPRYRQFPRRHVLPDEHHLEQRRMRGAARRLHPLHHLIERQVLMRLRRQHLRLRPLQQFAHRRLRRQIQPQRQRVHEEADQRFDLRSVPPRDRAADHHLLLSAQAAQHRRPARQQRHVRRHPVALAQALHPFAQRRAQLHLDARARVRLLRRTRTVRRQLQQRRCAGQVRLPERALLLQLAARQPPALPCGVVRVLQRQRRQRIALLRDERPVQRAQLLQEHPDRPAVRCDVVHHHLYDVGFIRQLQQQHSHRQVSAQVEWRRCVGLAQVLCPLFGLLRFAQVVVAHRQIGMRLDHLDRFTLLPSEARPQCFVTHHDTVQRTLQHLSIQRPIKPHRTAHVVRLADAFQLRQEP